TPPSLGGAIKGVVFEGQVRESQGNAFCNVSFGTLRLAILRRLGMLTRPSQDGMATIPSGHSASSLPKGARPASEPVRGRIARRVLGDPKDPLSPSVFHQLSLVAFLAWVGLGADGLSSSCYGP